MGEKWLEMYRSPNSNAIAPSVAFLLGYTHSPYCHCIVDQKATCGVSVEGVLLF